ncbi:MFS transporter [Anaerobacillus alkaliphilus]|uniref:MFS transporter n=1 Tax=Anaerobacillus alkaliphilus TaxID=1548597 RepID=A0A4Q0VNC4_9BACI|nr:MFS transporter [Anaerobacillus alkaliphilus]RXI96643.1 MFS transporter [Anaerobacillus alkaliphilus]
MSIYTAWKREQNYQKLFGAGLINGIGARFSQVAIFTLLFQLTGSAISIGMVLAIRMLPFLFFAPIGGMLADKFSKKHLLISIDLIRIPLILCLLLVQGPSDLWIVYFLTFLLATGEAIYSPTRMSSIPDLVKPDRLLFVNALEQAMVGIVLVIGASLGGIISYFFGLEAAFLLNGLTFLLSSLILSKLRFPAKESDVRVHKKKPVKLSRKAIVGSTALFTFFFIAVTMPLATGIDNVLVNVYALEVFKMGELGVGFIYASLGLGFIISSFFSIHLKKGLLFLTVLFIALEGIGHMVLSISPTFLLTLGIVVFITLVGGLSNICIDTVMMKVLPKSKRGTLFGLMQAVSNTALGFSMASGGFLLEFFQPRELSMVVGVSYIGFTVMYAILFLKVNLVIEKRFLMRKIG